MDERHTSHAEDPKLIQEGLSADRPDRADLRAICTIGAILDTHTRLRPKSPALTLGDDVMTYADLDARVEKISKLLLDRGLEPGDRLVHMGKASFAFFEVYFACARLGVIFVSLNLRLSPPEIAFQIGDCDPKMIAFDAMFAPLLGESDLGGRSLICLDSETAPTAQAEAYEAAIKGADHVDYQAAMASRAVTKPSSPLMMMYTSGTTGRPKGVLVDHQGWLAFTDDLEQHGYWFARPADESVIVATPMFHIAGIGWALMGLYHGQNLILVPDFVPTEVLAAIEKHRTATVMLVPVMIHFLLQVPTFKNYDLSALKTVFYGASPISQPLLTAGRQAFGVDFCQFYGMTESNGAATFLPPPDHDHPTRKYSAGRPYSFVQLEIRGPDGKALPPGEVGEVFVRSKSLMVAYFNRPGATAEVLKDGWYASGDGGYLDEDGYLFIKDRVKDMIISGGENVFPSEVEAVLAGRAYSADVAVFGIKDDAWGERVCAAIVRTPDAIDSVDEKSIRDDLRADLADYKIPKSIVFLDALPRNPSGKILRTELRTLMQKALNG